MYIVQHHAYCGMSGLKHKFDTIEEARSYIAQYLLRRRKQEYPVTTLHRGTEWEILEPEDCFMVPDACGILTLEQEEG